MGQVLCTRAYWKFSLTLEMTLDMHQLGIEAHQARALLALNSLNFVEACNDLNAMLIFLFEHLTQEHIHLRMKSDIIELLAMLSLGVTKGRNPTSNFSLNRLGSHWWLRLPIVEFPPKF